MRLTLPRISNLLQYGRETISAKNASPSIFAFRRLSLCMEEEESWQFRGKLHGHIEQKAYLASSPTDSRFR